MRTSNDGLEWQQTNLIVDAFPWAIAAGEMGWMLVEWTENEGARMWLSTDSLTWDGPHRLPEKEALGSWYPRIAAGEDTIFGIAVDWPSMEQVFLVGRSSDRDRGLCRW